jgi:hypothetical protein
LAFSLRRFASARSSLGVLFFAPGVRAMVCSSVAKKSYCWLRSTITDHRTTIRSLLCQPE